MAGALLHDINKVMILERDGKNGFKRKERPSEEMSPFPGVRIACDAGLSDDIVGLIEYSSRNATGNPNNVESIIVHHADMTTFDTMHFLNEIALQNDAAD